MPNAARVNDLTSHGPPLTGGPGSPDVMIGNMPAWRAIPAGVGDGLEQASKDIKEIMDKPLFTPPEVMPKVPLIQANMMKSAAAAAKEQNAAAPGGVTAAFTPLTAALTGLVAAYTAGAAVPGGEPAARTAFTMGFKAALGGAATSAVTAIAGQWDKHTCPIPIPPPHGTGLVTKGSTTVFINNLPAARQDDQVFEAAGGPDAISVGSPNVEIG